MILRHDAQPAQRDPRELQRRPAVHGAAMFASIVVRFPSAPRIVNEEAVSAKDRRIHRAAVHVHRGHAADG